MNAWDHFHSRATGGLGSFRQRVARIGSAFFIGGKRVSREQCLSHLDAQEYGVWGHIEFGDVVIN